MMHDREKVIKALESCISADVNCDASPYNGTTCTTTLNADALALLKEQEEREQAICKEICDFIRHACSTDTEDDKDYVCYVIQKCFKHFCADGERK